MRTNIEKLGDTLNKRMQKAATARVSVIAELGTITSNMGLQVASLGNVIPKGDYLISQHLIAGSTRTVSTTTENGGEHLHEGGEKKDGAHKHSLNIEIPSELKNLAPGDRVLVIWCENEPVVTSILVSS